MFKDRKHEATRSCDFLAQPVVSIKEEMKEVQMWLRLIAPNPCTASCPRSPCVLTAALTRIRVPTWMASLLISIWLRKNFISSLG